jgi:malate synthase
MKKNGLHLEIVIDENGTIGSGDAAHIDDVIVESALTSIIDLEDSIAAVDAEDKVLAYRNWHQIMCGTLTAEFNKNGKTMTRALNADKHFVAANGRKSILRGRALMLVRNVGHLMTNPAILLSDGSEIPEGILDAFISVAAALPDMSSKMNSPSGSIYVVKPKMHGPEEVAFAVDIFDMVEQLLN